MRSPPSRVRPRGRTPRRPAAPASRTPAAMPYARSSSSKWARRAEIARAQDDAGRRAMGASRTFTARHAGTCALSGRAFPAGTPVAYYMGELATAEAIDAKRGYRGDWDG